MRIIATPEPLVHTLMIRILEIRSRMEAACHRVGRNPEEVTLVAVAKGQPPERVQEGIEAGLTDIGENYAQELMAHSTQLSAVSLKPKAESRGLKWHFAGHLQRNKVREIIPYVALIHGVDSARLAREIDRQAAAFGKTQEVLIEINLGGEASKAGVRLEGNHESLKQLLLEMNTFSHVVLSGFMTLPPYDEDPEQVRPYFRSLKKIRDEINSKRGYKAPLTHLSMGMTHDFEVAIEEGATLIRIGTGIFGERKD